MEFMNRIEIRGVIGRVNVRQYGGRDCANFSVVTDYTYKNKDGQAFVETTWFEVTAWKDEAHGKKIVTLNELEKGKGVHVIGRLRQRSYTDESGETRRSYELIASVVEIVPRD